MGFYDEGGEHQEVYIIIILTSSLVSGIASILLIYLIHAMKLWNGFILLILAMSWAQLVYDASFYPQYAKQPTYIGTNTLVQMMQLTGGVFVSLYSNFLILVVLYIIWYKRSYDIIKNFLRISTIFGMFWLFNVIVFMIGQFDPKYFYLTILVHLYIYTYFRLISIALNFIACGLAYLYVYRARIRGENQTIQDQAICALVNRISAYPIIQAISRSGLTAYEFVYQLRFNPPIVTRKQFIGQMYFAIATPAASIGNEEFNDDMILFDQICL